jgi:chromosome segregation ATPase
LVDEDTAQEERQATQRLKQAEGKITTLMQELDELRFFQEIEAEQASPPPNGVAHLAMDKTIVQGPVTALSPRRLAGLDRTSLELEAQQLQRQVDILEREKTSLDATVKLQKASESSHQEDLKRIRKLEQTLKTVQQELSHQLDEIQTGRTKLTAAYEEKLRLLQEQYRTSKDTADDLLLHLEETQDTLEKLEKRHLKIKDDVAFKLKEKETAMQRQEEDWKKQVEERDEELSKMHEELVEASMSLEAMQSEKEETYEPRLMELERQVKETKSQHESLLSNCTQLEMKLQERDADLERARGEINDQAKELRETQSLLEEQQSHHAKGLAEVKTTLDAREKRRLDDLVVLQQDSNQEYERRLKALQQQLTLATDRHQMEMEQKDKEWQARLETSVSAATREIREEYEPKLRDSVAELALIQVKYEEAKQESLITQVKSESKDRDLAREWERKDAVRQGELDIMHDKLDRTVRELAEKEARIQMLQEQINESELRGSSSLVDLETRHAKEIAAREELLANQRKLWKASEGKLRIELARKESELVSLQERFGANHGMLSKELEESRKALDEAKTNAEHVEVLKQKLAATQSFLEQAQKDLISEQARHESSEEDLRVHLAKLEGRLSANETSLIEKKLAVEDLEQRLSAASEESSTAVSRYEHTILSLKAELESMRNSLTIEQSTLADKNAAMSKLEAERKDDFAKLERLSALEKKVLTLQRALSEVETEKEAQADELARLQQESQRNANDFEDAARTILFDKEKISVALERKDEEMKKLTESHADVIAQLNARLVEESSNKKTLQLEVETLQKSLLSANEVSESRSVDYTVFQRRINELEEQIDKQRQSISKNVTESQETVTLLKEQLAEAQKAQEEVAEKLEALANEKDEVVDALEQVINEVQGRDEEIESLTDILEKRDEELEHAKVIATKAIAQSQELQAKYKQRGERDSDRKADLAMQIDSLNVSLEFLTSKNEELQSNVTRLEEELYDKTLECKMLASGSTSPRDYGPTDKSRKLAVTDKEKKDSPRQSSLQRKLSQNGFTEFSPFDDRESESHKHGHDSSKSVDVGQTNEWFADFDDSDSRSDFHDVRSEPGINKSRQSIERDALRKYVRKRYLKHTASR